MEIIELTLYTTTISFIVFFLYYCYKMPKYVCENGKNGEKDENTRSFRLCTVYALLFSSAIGLLTLFLFTLFMLTKNQELVQEVIEQPTFKTQS